MRTGCDVICTTRKELAAEKYTVSTALATSSSLHSMHTSHFIHQHNFMPLLKVILSEFTDEP